MAEGTLERDAPAPRARSAANHCRACGRGLRDKRRKFCALTCRSELKRQLAFGNGLLRALSTRFAAFDWSEHHLLLHVLPNGGASAYGFLFPRRSGVAPGRDFPRLVFALGEQWWAAHDAGLGRRRATRRVLDDADRRDGAGFFDGAHGAGGLRPAGVSSADLAVLEIAGADLVAEGAEATLRRAYRRQAVATHPDQGGSDEQFRRVKEAFDALSGWLANPRMTVTGAQRGLPDKWLYDGTRRSWHPPRQ